jgi:hypothetical protein
MSDRKIILACKVIIAAIFFTCFGQLVEMFRELQFCDANDRSDKQLLSPAEAAGEAA